MAIGISSTLGEKLTLLQKEGWDVIFLPTWKDITFHAATTTFGEYDFTIKCGVSKTIVGHVGVLDKLPYFSALHNFEEGINKEIEMTSPWQGREADIFYSDFLEKYLSLWYLPPEERKYAFGRALRTYLSSFMEMTLYFGVMPSELDMVIEPPIKPLDGVKMAQQLAWHEQVDAAQAIISLVAGDLFKTRNLEKCYKAISELPFSMLKYLFNCDRLQVPSETVVLECITYYVKENCKKDTWDPQVKEFEDLFSLYEGKVTKKMYKDIQYLRNIFQEPTFLQSHCTSKKPRWPKVMGMVGYDGGEHWIGHLSINEIRDRDSRRNKSKEILFQQTTKMPEGYSYHFDACTGEGNFSYCIVSEPGQGDNNPMIRFYWMNIDLPVWTEGATLYHPFILHRPSLTLVGDTLYLIGGIECAEKTLTSYPAELRVSSSKVFSLQLMFCSKKELVINLSSWVERNNMITGRGAHGATRIGNKIHVTGGVGTMMIPQRTSEVTVFLFLG